MSNGQPAALEMTGERFVPHLAGDIAREHLHRYALARELCRGKQVLDIACGEGYGTALLADVAAHVTGVDVSAETVEHARRRYSRPNVDFRTGNCTQIPLAEASIDCLVSFETLEHFVEHEAFFREARRVLRPGGILLISTPDRDTYARVRTEPNKFHVRELSLAQFRGAIAPHFEHARFWGQRVCQGSLMIDVDSPTAASPFMTFTGSAATIRGSEGLPDAIYLLALASNSPLPSLPSGSLFQLPEDARIEPPARSRLAAKVRANTPAPLRPLVSFGIRCVARVLRGP